MNLKNIILSIALITLVTACEQKKPAQSVAPVSVPNSSAPLVEAVKTKKIDAPKVENSEKKSSVIVKETPEQFLADVTKHGREVTKSQESKTRTRAQLAEEEMLRDLEKAK